MGRIVIIKSQLSPPPTTSEQKMPPKQLELRFIATHAPEMGLDNVNRSQEAAPLEKGAVITAV